MWQPMDEFIDGVVFDLNHLRELLTPPVEQHKVRLASTVLRRLLIQGDLGKAWRLAAFSKEPRVSARSLKRFLEKNAHRYVAFASAGDAKYEAPPAPEDHRVTGI